MAEFDPHDHQQQTNAPPANDQTPSPEETVSINGKRHRKRTVFYITAVVIALLMFAAVAMDSLVSVARYILSILSPVIIGAVIAYLCDPILEFYEYRVFKKMHKGGLRRGLSLFLTVITAFGLIVVICAMMIPQLIKSITDLFNNYESYLNSLLGWVQGIVNKVTANYPSIDIDISDTQKLIAFLGEMFDTTEDAFSKVLSEVQKFATEGNLLENVWNFILSLFTTFKNLFLGIFIAFYILASKEKRVAQLRKFRKAMFTEKTDERIEEVITLTDKTFGGFIYGKLLDSLVIGILTFVMLAIFDVSPYNLLIAIFVGITNIIPVFGPFIGAIPSFFIVLISNPSKALFFILLILIIQQLDGNVIGPKILGDNTGVSSLCVIVAICICGSLWGIVGMLIGVPIFAVIIEMVKRMLEQRLAAKGEPTDTLYYYPSNAVGNAEQELYYEHSGLRYKYEHSRLKPRLEKIRNTVLSHLGRQSATDGTEVPPSSEQDETDQNDSNDSDNTNA